MLFMQSTFVDAYFSYSGISLIALRKITISLIHIFESDMHFSLQKLSYSIFLFALYLQTASSKFYFTTTNYELQILQYVNRLTLVSQL